MKNKKISDKLKKIKLFVTDFDGVHTNGKVCVDQNGVESVVCSRKDGLGFDMLKKNNIKSCIISKEKNPVVAERAKKLNIPYFARVENAEKKLDIFKQIISDFGLKQEETLFMGDDINDIDCLKFAGVSVVVADCHPSLEKIADYQTKNKGGDHAIREAVEMVLNAQNCKIKF